MSEYPVEHLLSFIYYYILKVNNKTVVSASFVYPGDCVADGELWLAATAQHHKSMVVLAHLGNNPNSKTEL